MNTTRLFSGIIGLLMIGQLLGCTDHRVPAVTPGSGASRLRVKTITQQLTRSPSVGAVSVFSYDGLGRLSSITAYQAPDSTVAPVEVSVYQYDAQNRLTQMIRNQVRRGTFSETYTYSYNGAGQVSNLTYRNNLGLSLGGTFSVNPSYNAANRITGVSKSFSSGQISVSESDMFTFTGNNLTSLAASSTGTGLGGPLPPQSRNVTFTYDTNSNPFYGVFVIPAPYIYATAPAGIFNFYTFYGGIANELTLSQNNVLSGDGTTYNYTYNAANLPASRTTITGGSIAEILRFEYETY